MGRQRGRAARTAVAALGVVLTLVGVAAAAIALGLVNPSFEDGLDGWTAETVRESVYYEDSVITGPDCSTPEAARRSVCVVGQDAFTAEGTSYTVKPIDGVKMARLGGPYTDSTQRQPRDRYRLRQAFTVDPDSPVLKLNYDVFTFDYHGYDELRYTVRVTDASGDEVTSFAQGGFGSGQNLKSTGWQSAYIDLTGYENQRMHLTIDSGGTSDNLYGFWAYVDAGSVPASPVGNPTLDAPAGTQTDSFADPLTSQNWVTVPRSAPCTSIGITVPIDPGSGAISDVSVLLAGTNHDMTQVPQTSSWTGSVPCQTGQLTLQYTLTEDGHSQTFLIPIGGLTLVDPSGVVYDRAAYDAARAAGATADAARATARIKGATVRLQRETDGVWNNVLSGDPGISPKVNPETTGEDGRFAWDVEAGTWRVVVAAPGFATTVSRAVQVPPEVTDLHVALERSSAPQPADDDGDGVPNGSDACPAQSGPGTANGCPAPPPAAAQAATAAAGSGGVLGSTQRAPAKAPGCSALKGAAKTACALKAKQRQRVAACKQLGKKRKRARCLKQAKALAKCDAKRGKAKRTCVTKAKRVGRPRRS